MPTSFDLPSSSSSLVSTPFSCPQASPFEYPYTTSNTLSASSPPYVPSNLATLSFSLGLNRDSLRGKGIPILMSLSKTKGTNDIKPPIPPSLMQKAGVLPSTSMSLPTPCRRWIPITNFDTYIRSMPDLLPSLLPLSSFQDNIDYSLLKYACVPAIPLSFRWNYETQCLLLIIACNIYDHTVRLQKNHAHAIESLLMALNVHSMALFSIAVAEERWTFNIRQPAN